MQGLAGIIRARLIAKTKAAGASPFSVSLFSVGFGLPYDYLTGK
jgi:hypothetical protein